MGTKQDAAKTNLLPPEFALAGGSWMLLDMLYIPLLACSLHHACVAKRCAGAF